MGNEAIARGAVEAGVEVVAAYPGTPSSEICETLAASAGELGYYIEWSTNEKVAFEVAAGASLVGARSLVAMKNAGLNVAMDTFMTLPYTGVKGAMVIVVADDPDAHYSSTEQDTRTAAMYAEILCLEPADQQEAKDMTRAAFELSEKLGLPVFVRSVTRISHASGDVTLGNVRRCRGASVLGFNKHWRLPYRWDVYGPPSGAAPRHKWLHEQLPRVAAEVESSPFNEVFVVGAHDAAGATSGGLCPVKLGIIAAGLGSSYAREALDRIGTGPDGVGGPVVFLKIGTAFPIPKTKVRQVLESAENVLVVEEGDPVVETQVKALACDIGAAVRVFGKTAGPGEPCRPGATGQDCEGPCGDTAAAQHGAGARTTEPGGTGGQSAARTCLEPVLPPYGEINTDMVADALRKVAASLALSSPDEAGAGERDVAEARSRLRSLVAPRSSTLCAGCPHLGSYWALREALRAEKGVHIVNGDIGCYEQGGYGIFSRAVQGDDADSKRYRVASPYEILDTIYVMGSGIGLAMGQVQAGYRDGKVVAVCGDSTFFHATLPAVVNAVYTQADITFLVFDNSWTCMTGHQPSPRTGLSTTGGPARTVSIEDVARSMGVESVAVADAYDIAAARAAVKEALAFKGPSVVVLRRECALQVQRRERRKGPAVTHVDRDSCTGCRICVELGCPAVTFDVADKKAGIDEILCVDCGLCAQVCPRGAIKPRGGRTETDAVAGSPPSGEARHDEGASGRLAGNAGAGSGGRLQAPRGAGRQAGCQAAHQAGCHTERGAQATSDAAGAGR